MNPKVLTALNYLAPIRRFMEDEEVNEIMVNAPDDVWVKRYGRRAVKETVQFSDTQIRSAITMMASVSNRQVGDEASERSKAKIISAGIPGFRFEAWTTPIAVRGPSFTVRKLASRLIGLGEYVVSGAIPADVAALLEQYVLWKRNVFVAGATGSGKTTLCNALLQQVPQHERLLVIETIHELHIGVPNHVLLEADEEQGYSINRLLVSSLRGLPDRIIIGEVRGPEAYGLLKATNTGHPGSIATLHANSSADSLERLEDMVLEGRPEMPLESIRRRIANTRPILIFMDQVHRGDMFLPTLTEVREVTGYAAGQYESQMVYQSNSKESL
jgi:pilus assembly protein CpaF